MLTHPPPSMTLPEFSNCRIVVAGDVMLDRYWHGQTARISPEAPVPVVRVNDIDERAGGAGNVAINIAGLGAQVSLMGWCGDDEAGRALARLLRRPGMDCHLRVLSNAPTITKLRVLSRHQQLIRLDFENPLQSGDCPDLSPTFERLVAEADVAILSDYGKGALNEIAGLIQIARSHNVPVLVDPKGQDFTKYHGATLMTPNRSEFEAVAGVCASDKELAERGRIMLEALKLKALLITRGEQGMTLIEADQPPLHLPAHAKEVYDVTGAGDTVIATLAAAMGVGKSLAEATHLANMAAGIVVGKLGTANLSRDDLDLALHGQRAQSRGVIELDRLLPVLESARLKGEKIVVTNGCFDILHPGHIDYLQRARELGDRLVVLVNSDASVRRLKGSSRPINALPHRLCMLAALECVDWVVAFDEDTPRDIIGTVLPDILVKGGDYPDITAIAGHDHVLANGGRVLILPFVEGHSTTGLIDRITQNIRAVNNTKTTIDKESHPV